MPSTSTDNGYRERKRLLYLRNKDKINTQRRMLYKTRPSTLLAESTCTTNVVPPEHPSTPIASATPPTTFPTSAQLARSNSNPFIPSPSMTLHIHPSTTPASHTPSHDCHNLAPIPSVVNMPSTSTDNEYRERKRQLYLQNKDKINTRRRMLYKTRRSTLLAESTRQTNVFPPEHPSTPVASPTPPTTLPTSAQLAHSNSNPFIPSPSMTLHIHPSTTPASNTLAHDCHNPSLEEAHHHFRAKLDQMHPLHVCSICKESYPSMKVKTFRGLPTCSRCAAERSVHRFSLLNNMDPGPQPHVLSALTQVEEMLIARVNPILQVSHARGGQLKYSGHTICFPQDITNIVNTLPRMLSELDILVVNKPTSTHKSYAFFVSRTRVMAALEYKLANDPYFKDVQINPNAVAALPLHPTDVSPLLRHVAGTSHATALPHENADLSNTCLLDPSTLHPSSFVATFPNSNTELDAIHAYLETPHSNPTSTLQWPTVGLSPINEYNTEGLFSIAFPSLFPTDSSMINQPRLRDVEMNELALHLMRYHDNRFAQHPRFRYFLYNLIMRHRSQSTASVFVKKSIEDNLPATAADLRQHLLDLQHSTLPDQIMRFGSSLRGTQSYWNKCRGELSDMITQLGTPTLFFTLSAADTKWHDLHQLMPGIPPTNPADQHKWRIKNIIANPHLASQYIHCRFALFLEEVLKKGFHTTDYWCRYEWQHRGSAHIHGFLWLEDAPNMDTLDWNNVDELAAAKNYFDRYLTAQNPRPCDCRTPGFPSSSLGNPCLLTTAEIFASSLIYDYEALVNCVQRHTKCHETTCLRTRGSSTSCRYGFPKELCSTSSMHIDEKGRKIYTPARNDDSVNIHNRELLSIWRANMDCQPVLSQHAVLRYISKYASKAEPKSESYIQMLARLANSSPADAPVGSIVRRVLTDLVADRDIGAQETCHMLQKLPLIHCSRSFVSLNVNRKVFRRVPHALETASTPPPFIASYMHRPPHLESLSLLEVARSWTFSANRKSCQWKHIHPPMVVRVFPRHTTVPSSNDESFVDFCWSELLLYCPFRNLPEDIGSTDEALILHYNHIKGTYSPWHARCTLSEDQVNSSDDETTNEPQHHHSIEMDEWQLLSHLHPGNNMQLDDLDMLGHRDFDENHNWTQTSIPSHLQETAIRFIEYNRSSTHSHHHPPPKPSCTNSFSPNQSMAYDIVLSHFKNTTSKTPLKMIIQGTAGTGKSFLISCLSDAFLSTCPGKPSPLLLLAPTGVAAFHINAQTIHSALRIPISNMHPLEGQSLLQLQEQLRHVEYILIDEMSFIGPTMLSQIDARLRQAFPSHNNSPFGGRSIILVGDLRQLPPVKDIPMYVGTSHGNALWRTFDTIVTLGTVFRQQGDNAPQIAFRSLLANLRNATPTIEDWNLLMSRTDSNMSHAEIQTFEEPIHLYATNQCVALHNKQMLQKLNMPIARSYAEQTKSNGLGTHEDEQLDAKVLLCVGQQVLLTTNLWVESGLVNGALGKVISILYAMHSKPPDLPLFVVIDFVHYKGPAWDVNNPKQVPISPISRGSRRQLPIRMAWGLTIHKSQGMTLPKATIDIGNIDRQGLTFTAISRVKSLSGLRISPAFTYTRYSRMEDNPYVNRRKREEALLSSKSLMPPT